MWSALEIRGAVSKQGHNGAWASSWTFIVVASRDRACLYAAMMFPTAYTGTGHHLTTSMKVVRVTLSIQLSLVLACRKRKREPVRWSVNSNACCSTPFHLKKRVVSDG